MCEPKNTQTGITFPEHLNVSQRTLKLLFPKTVCELQKVSDNKVESVLAALIRLCNKAPEWSDLHGYVNKSCLILHEYLLGARHPKSTAISLISQICSSDCKWLASCIKYQRNRVALHF